MDRLVGPAGVPPVANTKSAGIAALQSSTAFSEGEGGDAGGGGGGGCGGGRDSDIGGGGSDGCGGSALDKAPRLAQETKSPDHMLTAYDRLKKHDIHQVPRPSLSP